MIDQVEMTDVTGFHRQGWLNLGRILTDDELQIAQDACLQEHELARAAERSGSEGQGDESVVAKHFSVQTSEKFLQMFHRRQDLRLTYPSLVPLVTKIANIARELLGEELKLQSVPTFWCGDESSRSHVLAHFD